MTQAWLEENRKRAAQLNARLPIPTGGEEWRRTNFGRVDLNQFTPLPPAANGAKAGAASQLLPVKMLLAGEILYGEQTSPFTLDKSLTQKGVILAPLAQACEQHGALVERYLGRGLKNREEKFLAQNEVSWQTGVFLYIPPNTEVVLPLLLAGHFTREKAALFPRLLIVLDKGAKATALRWSSSRAEQTPHFVNEVQEIYLEEDSDLSWIQLQDLSELTYQVSLQRTELGRNTRLKWVTLQRGGKIAKTNLETVLNGEGAQAEVCGLIQGKEREHLELASLTHHRAPHTKADILIKATADHRARTVFQGMIKIDKPAQQTESFLANHNLVLSDKAHADSIPRLEIEADDVKASHGATIGQVDAEQMFYLRSKGLPKERAETLLVEGFTGDIFGRIPLEPLREWLRG